VTKAERDAHDTALLAEVHPVLADKARRILAAMAELGFPMCVTDGLRTDSEQVALYAKGRTTPGPVVTNADGVIKRSNHQRHSDGWGRAVDMAFLDENNQPTWSDEMPWNCYAECARALGLIAGAMWVHFPDRPHIELPHDVK